MMEAEVSEERDLKILFFEKGGRAPSQGIQATYRSWKGKEWILLKSFQKDHSI